MWLGNSMVYCFFQTLPGTDLVWSVTETTSVQNHQNDSGHGESHELWQSGNAIVSHVHDLHIRQLYIFSC